MLCNFTFRRFALRSFNRVFHQVPGETPVSHVFRLLVFPRTGLGKRVHEIFFENLHSKSFA